MRVGWKKYEATKKGEERDGCEESRKERNPCGRLIRACSSIHPLFIHRPPPLFFFFEFPPFSVLGHSATFSLGRLDKGERESSQSTRSQANYPCKESFSWISPLCSCRFSELCMVRKGEAAGWNSVLPNPQTRGGI